MHSVKNTLRFGEPLPTARLVVILIHGRGSSAEEIARLANYLPKNAGIAFLAPEATGNVWYPQRFFRPLHENEPWLSSAFEVIGQLIAEIGSARSGADRLGSVRIDADRSGSDRIAMIGFSQGACLALEYAARNPRRYAFVGGLSGGLIGPLDTPRPVEGRAPSRPPDRTEPVPPISAGPIAGGPPSATLTGTPILLGCAERDAHIPIAHVEHSAVVLKSMGADVTKQIFPGSAHTLFPEEIAWLLDRSQAVLER